MCLVVDAKKNEQFLNSTNQEPITAYKILLEYGETYFTLYMMSKIEKCTRVVSKKYSIVPLKLRKRKLNKKVKTIEGGALHLFLDEELAKGCIGHTKYITTKRVLFEVKVYRDDVISFGKDNDIAVKAYTLIKRVKK